MSDTASHRSMADHTQYTHISGALFKVTLSCQKPGVCCTSREQLQLRRLLVEQLCQVGHSLLRHGDHVRRGQQDADRPLILGDGGTALQEGEVLLGLGMVPPKLRQGFWCHHGVSPKNES